MQIKSALLIPKTDTRFNLDGIPFILRGRHSLDLKGASKNVQALTFDKFPGAIGWKIQKMMVCRVPRGNFGIVKTSVSPN